VNGPLASSASAAGSDRGQDLGTCGRKPSVAQKDRCRAGLTLVRGPRRASAPTSPLHGFPG